MAHFLTKLIKKNIAKNARVCFDFNWLFLKALSIRNKTVSHFIFNSSSFDAITDESTNFPLFAKLKELSDSLVHYFCSRQYKNNRRHCFGEMYFVNGVWKFGVNRLNGPRAIFFWRDAKMLKKERRYKRLKINN